MSVNEAISAYSTAAASNTPAGTDPIGTNLDDHIRDVKKNIRILSNEASAFQAQEFFPADPSLFLSAATSVSAGGGLTAVNQFTLGMANAFSTTAHGTYLVEKIDIYGRILDYTAASTLTASDAEVASGDRTDVFVTPNSLHNSPAAVKAWVSFDGSGTASSAIGYRANVIRSAAGVYVVSWIDTFTTANYPAFVNHGLGISSNALTVGSANQTTTTYKFALVRTDTGGKQDCARVHVMALGVI